MRPSRWNNCPRDALRKNLTRPGASPRRSAGFTILELMVAVTVTAILAAIAVPTMRDYLRNSRLTTASNDLLHSLAVARAEAIKRQTNTIVCGTALPNAAAPVCDGSPFSAWVVFVDANRNGAYDAGEVVIIRHGPLDPSVTPPPSPDPAPSPANPSTSSSTASNAPSPSMTERENPATPASPRASARAFAERGSARPA